MKIKKWPPWRKGGFIALGILLLIVIIDFIYTCDFGTKAEFCGVYTLIVTSPVSFSFGNLYFWIFSSIIFYFAVGALIGYIIGKILKK